MPKTTLENQEVFLKGVSKMGWPKLTAITLSIILALVITFFHLNNIFGWIEILPW